MDQIFFSDLESVKRILITTPIIYFLVIFYIRIVGKRSTSKMNNYDWIVTVAVGGLFASTIIFKSITIADGTVSILTLLFLQYVVNKLMLKSDAVKMLFRSTPQLMLYDGELLTDNMKKERLLESEIWAAIRESGLKSKKQVHAVVFETNAKLSVIPKDNNENICFSIADVEGLPEGLKKSLKEKE